MLLYMLITCHMCTNYILSVYHFLTFLLIPIMFVYMYMCTLCIFYLTYLCFICLYLATHLHVYIYRDPELTLTRIAYVKALLCLDNDKGDEGRISDSGFDLASTQAYEDLTASAPMEITQTPYTSHLSSNSTTATTTTTSHEGKAGHNSDPSAARLSFDLCTAIVTDHIRTTRVLNETNYNEVKNIFCLKISMYRANKHYTSVIIWAELALRLLESYHLSATSHFSTLSTSTSTSSTHVECDKVYNDWTSITLYKADALTCLSHNSEGLALTLSLIPTTKSVKVLVAVYKTAILYKGAEYALRLLIHIYTTIHLLNDDNTTTTPPWKSSNNSNIALKKSLLAAESIAGPISLHTLATTQTAIYVNFAELLIMCHDCVINELEDKGQNYDHRSIPVLSPLIVYSARIILHTAWLEYYIHSKGWRKLGALGQELQPINRYSGEEDVDDKQTFLNISCQAIRLFLDKHLQQRDVVVPSSTRQQHSQKQLAINHGDTTSNNTTGNGPDQSVDARLPVNHNVPTTDNTDSSTLTGNKRPRIDDTTTAEATTVPYGDTSHTLTTVTDTVNTWAAEEGLATIAIGTSVAFSTAPVDQDSTTAPAADKNNIEAAAVPAAQGEVSNTYVSSPSVTTEPVPEHGTEESPHKKQALQPFDSGSESEQYNQIVDTSELVAEAAVLEAVVVKREETALVVINQGDNTVLGDEVASTGLTLITTAAAVTERPIVQIEPGQSTVDMCTKDIPHNSDPSPPAENLDLDSQSNRYHALFLTSTSSTSEANETDDLLSCWMDSSIGSGYFEFDCSLDDLCICVYSRLQDADSVLRVVQSEEEGCDVSAVGSYFHLEWLAGIAWLVIYTYIYIYIYDHMHLMYCFVYMLYIYIMHALYIWNVYII